MPPLRLHYPAAALCVAALMLSGCGESPSIIGTSAAMPQASTTTQRAVHKHSWMRPEAKLEDLLYVSDWGCCVRVFSYPKGEPVGVLLDVAPRLQGECSDKAGNVWVTSFGASEILEFAHGGTKPIAVITEDRNTDPVACSVDPVTGDLAVANTNSTLAIFPHAQGSPTIYSDPGGFLFCTYDSDGNLFADGLGRGVLDELPRGGSALTRITLSKAFVPISLQWDGANLAMTTRKFNRSKEPLAVYRVHVSGTTGSVISSAILHHGGWWLNQVWVQGRTIMGPGPSPNNQTSLFDFWSYPAGGRPKKSFSVTEYPGDGAPAFTGETVSVAPK